MRKNVRPELEVGDEEINSGFLLLPLTIRDERRWLEKATYLTRVKHKYTTNGGWTAFVWEMVCWLDTPEEIADAEKRIQARASFRASPRRFQKMA